MAIEDMAVRLVGPGIGSSVVGGHPRLQSLEHGVLLRERSVLVGFPGTTTVVGEACCHPWVEEYEFSAGGCEGRNEVAVATFDDPGRVVRQERAKGGGDRFRGTLDRHLTR